MQNTGQQNLLMDQTHVESPGCGVMKKQFWSWIFAKVVLLFAIG